MLSSPRPAYVYTFSSLIGETRFSERVPSLNARSGLQSCGSGANSTEQVYHQIPVPAEDSTCSGVRVHVLHELLYLCSYINRDLQIGI